MTHGDKRRLFTHNIAMLILYAETLGYSVAIGNTTGATGNKNSLHPSGLAVDMHLYEPDANGKLVYQRGLGGHKKLGAFWLTLHPYCKWGGTTSNDYNHFSFSSTTRW